MTEETVYWVFSTMAQTYAAILGIIGMLTIYKLQNLYNSKKDAVKQADNPSRKLFSVNVYTKTPEELVEWWESGARDIGISHYHNDMEIIDRAIGKIKQINTVKGGIKKSFLFFLYSHLVIISISILFLIFSKGFAGTGYYIFFVVVLFILMSSITTARLCISFLKE